MAKKTKAKLALLVDATNVNYLTDGRRLVEVLVVEDTNSVIVHDVADSDESSQVVIHQSEIGRWRLVERADAA